MVRRPPAHAWVCIDGEFATVMRVPLKRETTSVAVQARQRAALGIWDRIREVDGLGRWCVAYVGAGGTFLPGPPLLLINERGGVAGPSTSASVDDPEAYAVKDVTARVRRDADVYVPHVGDLVQSTEEDAEDYQERLEALFEWVGMACLGAQRQVPSHLTPRGRHRPSFIVSVSRKCLC